MVLTNPYTAEDRDREGGKRSRLIRVAGWQGPVSCPVLPVPTRWIGLPRKPQVLNSG